MKTGYTPEQIENIVNRFTRYGCDAGSLGHRDVLAIIEQLRAENERLRKRLDAPEVCHFDDPKSACHHE